MIAAFSRFIHRHTRLDGGGARQGPHRAELAHESRQHQHQKQEDREDPGGSTHRISPNPTGTASWNGRTIRVCDRRTRMAFRFRRHLVLAADNFVVWLDLVQSTWQRYARVQLKPDFRFQRVSGSDLPGLDPGRSLRRTRLSQDALVDGGRSGLRNGISSCRFPVGASRSGSSCRVVRSGRASRCGGLEDEQVIRKRFPLFRALSPPSSRLSRTCFGETSRSASRADASRPARCMACSCFYASGAGPSATACLMMRCRARAASILCCCSSCCWTTETRLSLSACSWMPCRLLKSLRLAAYSTSILRSSPLGSGSFQVRSNKRS